MSYNGPPPPYSEAAAMPKPKTGVMPGHVMQTPLGPIQPHVDAMKPAPGEFMSSMVNPYASPKQRPNPNTNSSYPVDEKVPYSQTSQLESGPYPGGTLQYSRNVGSGTASYQSPPNSIIGNGPPRYESMPSPRMPVGSGATPGGIYPSVGGYTRPPYPTDTFERGMNQPGAPQGYPMPRPSNYTRDSSPPRIDQMNISGSPNNYPPVSRPYSPYSANSTYPPNVGSGTASYQSSPNSHIGSGTASYQSPPNSNIGSGASYQSPPNSIIGSGTSYQNSPSPIIGSGASRGYPSPPIGHGTSQGYPRPRIGSGTGRYSPPTAGGYPPPGSYSTPPHPSRSDNFLPARPIIGGIPLVGGYGSGVIGHSSGSCTSVPSSGYCSQYPSSNYCHTKRKNSSSSSSSTSTDSSISAHHSHHHHHHC